MSSTGQAVQTKFDTPRAKKASAKLGARSTDRSSERSGVISDSHAFENMNLGMRSTRFNSRSVMRAPFEMIYQEDVLFR